jgi:hypothetical protein
MWELPVADDAVFGPRVVRGRCRCRVCGEEIFPADAALSKWAEPVDIWVHYNQPDDDHDVVFGYWVAKR